MKESGKSATASRTRRRVRAGLVVAEVALAVLLLVGAGLLVRSFAALQSVDPGFRPAGVLTMRLTLPAAEYPDDERVVAFYRELRSRLASLPQVRAVGGVTNLPLASSLGDLNFEIEGRPVPAGARNRRADWQAITPGYFEAVGMRLVRGRGVEERDDERAPGVIVINESLARLHWPGQDPLGQRMLLGGGAGPGWVTVVGLVGDVRHAALNEPPQPEMYIPQAQFRFWGGGGAARGLNYAIRTRGNPAELAGAVRAQVRRLDPNLPVAEVQTLAQVRADAVAQPRFLALLLGSFASLALILAALGIYGTLAHLVSQRTHEIGIRMALGARAQEIVGLVVRSGLLMALAGIAIGVAVAAGLTRLMAHLLYGISTTDLFTFVLVPALLVLVAAAASYVPARRATRVEPVQALRAD